MPIGKPWHTNIILKKTLRKYTGITWTGSYLAQNFIKAHVVYFYKVRSENSVTSKRDKKWDSKRYSLICNCFPRVSCFCIQFQSFSKAYKEQNRHGIARQMLPVPQPEPKMNITFLISRISTSKKTNTSFRSVQ